MAIASLDLESSELAAVLDRLVREDAIGQLLERRGRMAELATESGDVKLDWVDQVAWALGHPASIGDVEKLAASIRLRFTHVVWSGMGGSVQAVRTLKGIDLFGPDGPWVHPLDTSDPAALNRLLRELAPDGELASTLAHTVMVGVSMGMTSEEPITHLRWFEELLGAQGVDQPAAHMMVMTLPGSFLDQFAEERGALRVDVQLDGESHTPGRMSAPSTKVFLLPAALGLPGRLQEILRRCQAETGLRPGPWVEQVVEESLGKEERGLLVFHDQDMASASAWPDRFCILRVDEGSGGELPDRPLAVLHLDSAPDLTSRAAACARSFSGWNLAVALVGYLQGITFAGQPAVEHYKSYARQLRDADGALPYPANDLARTDSGRLELFSGAAPVPDLDGERRDAGAVLATVVRSLKRTGRLGYFDLTVNGESAGPLWDTAVQAGTKFGNRILERPTKVRSGPRDYHSTEQSETAGPPELLSLRVLVRDPEPVAAGEYSGRFLHAQALGTLFAMRDAGRPVLLATVRRADAPAALVELLEEASAQL